MTLRPKLATILVAGAATLGLLTVSAGPASAVTLYNRSGNTTFGGSICVASHCLPQGLLYVGSVAADKGNHSIMYIDGAWQYAGTLCNWWIDFDILSAGTNLFHSQGSSTNCSHTGQRGITMPLPTHWYSNASVCSTLYRRGSSNFIQVARACQSIDG